MEQTRIRRGLSECGALCSRLLARDWPPMVAWGVAILVVVTGAITFGYDPLDSTTWARWDSNLYEAIARDGYDLFPCREGIAPGTWCGDAGWFPAYSWVVAALHQFGLPIRGSAVAVSWLFAGATLALLWATFLGRRLTAAAVIVLAYAAFAPGQIYSYAVFPLSMLTFFTVAHLWLLHRSRFVAAGVAGAVAVLSYPLGVLLVPVSAVWLLSARGAPLRERLRRTAWASGLTLAGFGVLLVDQRIETGRWNAYFLVQEKYDHQLQSPFTALRSALYQLRQGSPFELDNAPAFQTVLVTSVLFAVLLLLWVRRRSFARLDCLLVLWAIVTWAFPLSQTNVSISRSQAALLPLALLVGRLPRLVALAFVVAAVIIAVTMEKLFLQGSLV